jgi:hypothetical protein
MVVIAVVIVVYARVARFWNQTEQFGKVVAGAILLVAVFFGYLYWAFP